MKLLEVEHISKTYKIGEVEVRALQDISLTIEEKPVVALVISSVKVEDNSAPTLPGNLDAELSNDFKAESKAVLINISKMIADKIATDDFNISLENSTHLLDMVRQMFNL